MPIQQLAPDVAAKIAAGEVIEKPASVVKELVENALDSGARQIRVELSNGGLQLIRVSDDGTGIPATELPLAFARHATSKITRLADLAQVSSLGFRGEALSSIGSVAEVTLRSRLRGAELGAEISMRDGELGQVSVAAPVDGTAVTVRNLFASVPARLKFLKSRSAEAGRAVQVVEQYALAYPEVRFSVESEARQVLATPGDGKLASVLVAVYGVHIAEAMIPLPTKTTESLLLGAGWSQQLEAAGMRLEVDGYVSRPSCYKSNRNFMSIFVNRRWVQSRTLAYAIEEAYHSLLLQGRHPIAIVRLKIDPSQLDVNVHPAKTEVRFLHERMVYGVVHRAVRAAVLASAGPPEISEKAFEVPKADAAGTMQLPLGAESSGFTPPPASVESPVEAEKLPVLRVLGQMSESYIITEGPDGMYLVDQHAAHERILLERMIAGWRSQTMSSQLLLQPLPIELSASELEAVLEHLPLLRSIGFELEEFGDCTVLVRALPGVLNSLYRPQPIRELLLELVGADQEAAGHGETWEEHALANVACKAAIKAGQPLLPDEQRELIRQLEVTDARQSCCHGRPTMVHISLATLERQFDRR
ncbi:MAG: DNA mismatch repair endonuclease MutL [Ktedonobacterales bacterium]